MMKKQELYSAIARALDAYLRCIETGNAEWEDKHENAITQLVYQHLPSGSGFDSGTKLDFETSKPNRLVFWTAFHHMDENGMYDGWTKHAVIVTASLVHGFELRVTGPNRNDIKEYIAQVFRD